MTTVLFDDNESSIRTDSEEGGGGVSKFWYKPSGSAEVSVSEPGDFSIAFEQEGLLDNHSERHLESSHDYEGGLLLGQRSAATSPTSASKRRQTKMLLVSLIESFCRVYGDSPQANHKVFFLICQTLRSLGLIDSEFVDEMANVRSAFQNAFRRLFYTAVQTVRDQENLYHQQRRMISSSPWLDEEEEEISGLPSLSTPCHQQQQQHDELLFNLSVQNSRYRNDFVEIGLMGKGGFASVWRARNKLDGIEYAIKKVRLGRDLDTSCAAPYEKIFREIKHLARLEHRNVVRYYASWLEYASASSAGDNRVVEEELEEDESDSVFHGRDPTFDDDSSLSIRFNNDKDTLSSPGIDFVGEGSEEEVVEEISESQPTTRNNPRADGEWVLYIQMQLCPVTLHDYIKIRNREGCVNPERNIEIFSQILEGAAYIHEQGVIHRDLKPTNIFLSMPASLIEHQRRINQQSFKRRSRANSMATSYSMSPSSFGAHSSYLPYDDENALTGESILNEPWVPKIGDFGLAAPMMEDVIEEEQVLRLLPSSSGSGTTISFVDSAVESSSSASSGNRSCMRKRRPSMQRTHTSGVGTQTYASPEQLARGRTNYDEKVDIYSLGIIFFELYQPFSTAMERAEAIESLKHGVFPDGFVERYPKESALILWMMDHNPAHRPSAADLLEFELFAEPKDSFAILQSELEAKMQELDTKTQEMAALKDRMQQLELEKQREMDAMKRRLEELQRQLEEAKLNNNTTKRREEDLPMSPPNSNNS